MCLNFEFVLYVTELELSLVLLLRNALNTSAFDLLSSSAALSAGMLSANRISPTPSLPLALSDGRLILILMNSLL